MLYVVLFRVLATCPWEGGASFVSERFPMAYRSFQRCQLCLKNLPPTVNTSTFACPDHFLSPRLAVAFLSICKDSITSLVRRSIFPSSVEKIFMSLSDRGYSSTMWIRSSHALFLSHLNVSSSSSSTLVIRFLRPFVKVHAKS